MAPIQPFPVEKEYEKNPDINREDIAKLREWLKTQPHLPAKYLTDLDLFLTFYSCDKSTEVTKQVLDLHFTLRTLFTALFKDRKLSPSTLMNLESVLYAPLATPSHDGSRAIYARLLDPDPRKFNFADCIRSFMMVFDLWQTQEGTWPGLIIMIDLDTVSLSHVAKLDIMTIRQTLYFLQECMLVILKSVHFLNAPYFMDKIMMLLKPFMKKSLLDIIHIHTAGSEDLYKFIPKKAFPKECGGEFKDFKSLSEEWLKLIEENAQFFKDESLKRVDENLRANGKKATVEDLFGIQGSFKKLDID